MFVFFLFCVAVFSAVCSDELPLDFLNGTCGSSVKFVQSIPKDICAPLPQCNTCDPSCCLGQNYSTCLSCSSCATSGSFFISNGTMTAYLANDCTGLEFAITDCIFSFFNLCGNKQISAAAAINASLCVEPPSTTTTTTTMTSGTTSTTSTTSTSSTTSTTGNTARAVSSAAIFWSLF